MDNAAALPTGATTSATTTILLNLTHITANLVLSLGFQVSQCLNESGARREFETAIGMRMVLENVLSACQRSRVIRMEPRGRTIWAARHAPCNFRKQRMCSNRWWPVAKKGETSAVQPGAFSSVGRRPKTDMADPFGAEG